MNFAFKWRHQDGSTIELNPSGWASDDPFKADWLSEMSQHYRSVPPIPPDVLLWLQEHCELVAFSGPKLDQ